MRCTVFSTVRSEMHVEDGEMDAALRSDSERFIRTADSDDFEPTGRQGRLQHQPRERVVLDDERGDGHA